MQNHVYDEHTHTLQIYWSTRDVITWLAENSDDEHLKKVKQNAEQHALKMEVASRSVHDEKALFDEDDNEEDEIVLGRTNKEEPEEVGTSKQRQLSKQKLPPTFEGLKTLPSGHKIQEIRELMTVPVRCLLGVSVGRECSSWRAAGHRHRRPHEEPSCHQGLQRQPLRSGREEADRLNIWNTCPCSSSSLSLNGTRRRIFVR